MFNCKPWPPTLVGSSSGGNLYMVSCYENPGINSRIVLNIINFLE